MESSHMREFWNERAREDAYFFVDDRRTYRDGDLEQFWAAGEETVDALLAVFGEPVGPQDTVLDIGCGVGRLTRALAARAARVYAIDVSSEMLALARTHHAELANIEWILGDGVSLAGVPDGEIDGCISHVVFQHIPDPAVTLGYVAEMGRVLKPGGWSGFQVSNDPNIHRAAPAEGGLVRKAMTTLTRTRRDRGPQGRDDPAWLGSAIDLGELRDVASGAGLEIAVSRGEGTQFCMVLAHRVA
jgi:SAM-dependent methyltransferase